MTTPTKLRFNDHDLDTTPAAFGLLRASTDAVADRDELHRRMAADGYVYLPGYLDRAAVAAARQSSLLRLAAQDLFVTDAPLDEARLKPGIHMRSAQDVPLDNDPLLRLLYGGRMIEFYEFFLGGPVHHYDYTWFRAKTPTPNSASEPHCDIVYMGRGTPDLYTSWTPLGDIPQQMGGLLVLEKSHLHAELKRTYGQTDIDVYCENEGEAAAIVASAKAANRELTPPERTAIRWTTLGAYADDPVAARHTLGGRWLTADYQIGDLLVFTMFTLHCSHTNQTDRLRISTDTRYQLASEPIDPRWIGEEPPGNDIRAKRGTIC